MNLILSDRINRIQTSQTIEISDLARNLLSKGRKVISLSQGEPDFDTPDHIKEAGIKAIKDGFTRYSNVDGMPLLKKAIIKKFLNENNLEYKLSEISVGNGCKQIIFNALMSILNPGDEVIIPAPYWGSYKDMVDFAEGIPKIVNCTLADDFKLTAKALELAINDSTRCLILNNPTNPSGSVYNFEELKSFSDVLIKYPNILIISDDIYEYLIYSKTKFHTIAEIDINIKKRTLTCNGMSKNFCMTGWRLGYAAGPKLLIDAMAKLQSQSTFHPSTISQFAALAALNGGREFITDQKKSYIKRRDLTVSFLNKIDGITCNNPEGSFYVFPSCDGLYGRKTPGGEIIQNDIDVCKYILETAEVTVVPGSVFGKIDFFRICYAIDTKTLLEALNRILTVLEKLKTKY
jgi:aspartate aminotransferase